MEAKQLNGNSWFLRRMLNLWPIYLSHQVLETLATHAIHHRLGKFGPHKNKVPLTPETPLRRVRRTSKTSLDSGTQVGKYLENGTKSNKAPPLPLLRWCLLKCHRLESRHLHMPMHIKYACVAPFKTLKSILEAFTWDFNSTLLLLWQFYYKCLFFRTPKYFKGLLELEPNQLFYK